MSSARSTLTALTFLLAACEPGDKTATDTQASTESPDGGTGPSASRGSDAGIVIPGLEEEGDAGRMPQACTLADAQETLDGLWSRSEATDVWTEGQVAQCKATCGHEPDPNQCAIDRCTGGGEYIACVFGWRYYCASQPESGCADLYRDFGCCVRANCVAADDEACVTAVCSELGKRMATCADTQCATTARAMCVR